MYDIQLRWYEGGEPGTEDALFATCPKCGYNTCGKWPKKLGKPNNYHCAGCHERYRRMPDGTYEPLDLTRLEFLIHVAP